MSTHTPGPWRAELTDDTDTWAITAPPDYDYETIVVWADAGVNGEANAHLIAAAPELLAACELAITYIEDGAPQTAAVRLRTAIAKARGEASNG